MITHTGDAVSINQPVSWDGILGTSHGSHVSHITSCIENHHITVAAGPFFGLVYLGVAWTSLYPLVN